MTEKQKIIMLMLLRFLAASFILYIGFRNILTLTFFSIMTISVIVYGELTIPGGEGKGKYK